MHGFDPVVRRHQWKELNRSVPMAASLRVGFNKLSMMEGGENGIWDLGFRLEVIAFPPPRQLKAPDPKHMYLTQIVIEFYHV